MVIHCIMINAHLWSLDVFRSVAYDFSMILVWVDFVHQQTTKRYFQLRTCDVAYIFKTNILILIWYGSMPWDTTQGPLRVHLGHHKKSDPNLTKMEVWRINSHGFKKKIPTFFRCWKCFQGYYPAYPPGNPSTPLYILDLKTSWNPRWYKWWKRMKSHLNLILRKIPSKPTRVKKTDGKYKSSEVLVALRMVSQAVQQRLLAPMGRNVETQQTLGKRLDI